MTQVWLRFFSQPEKAHAVLRVRPASRDTPEGIIIAAGGGFEGIVYMKDYGVDYELFTREPSLEEAINFHA